MYPTSNTESNGQAVVVEPDARERFLLWFLLRRLGFRVRAAERAGALRQTGLAADFDWLFYDVTSGDDLVTIGSIRLYRPATKIVALVTGGSTARLAYAASALEYGATDFLVKPYSASSFQTVVDALDGR